jgi:hypothetical protein
MVKTKKRIINKKAKTEKKNNQFNANNLKNKKHLLSKILLDKLTKLSRKKTQFRSCNQDKHVPPSGHFFNDSIEFDKYYLKNGDKIPLFEKISWVISTDVYPNTNTNTNKKIGGHIYSDEYRLYPTPFFERLRDLKNPPLSNDQIKNIIKDYDLSLFNIEHKKQNQLFLNKIFQDTEQKLAGILEGLKKDNIDSSKNYKITVND